MKRVFAATVLVISITAGAYAGNGDLIVDGKLGVGALNSGAKLHVNSGDNAVGSVLATNNEGPGELRVRSYTTSPANVQSFGILHSFYNDENNGFIKFFRGESANGGFLTFGSFGSERVRIDGTGNVGIGTADPKNKLHIYQAVKDSVGLIIQGNTINTDNSLHYVGMTFDGDYGNAVGNYSQIRSYSNLYSNWGSSLAFLTTNLGSNTFSEKMRITANGNIGIGKTNPLHKLDVNGEIWANDVLLTSDERYKKNIIPVQNALATILKIEGVSYEWKQPEDYLDAQTISAMADVQVADKRIEMISGRADGALLKESKPETKNFPAGRHYGVLAQAIEKVLPEVVSTDLNGEKAVAYSGMIPMLIEAIKEQQKLIENQQAEIAAIKKLVLKSN